MNNKISGFYTQLKELIDRYPGLFKELEAVEQHKYQGAKDSDLEALNTAMKEEQVLILTLKGYEQKREALYRELDIPEKTSLRNLSGVLPEDAREDMEHCTRELLTAYESFRSTYEKTREILMLQARVTDRKLKELDRRAAAASPYQPDGTRESPSFHTMKNIHI